MIKCIMIWSLSSSQMLFLLWVGNLLLAQVFGARTRNFGWSLWLWVIPKMVVTCGNSLYLNDLSVLWWSLMIDDLRCCFSLQFNLWRLGFSFFQANKHGDRWLSSPHLLPISWCPHRSISFRGFKNRDQRSIMSLVPCVSGFFFVR